MTQRARTLIRESPGIESLHGLAMGSRLLIGGEESGGEESAHHALLRTPIPTSLEKTRLAMSAHAGHRRQKDRT